MKILRGREMTQQQLAQKTCLSLGAVQKAEQGQRVSLPTLLKLADGFGVDVSVLIGQQEPRRTLSQADRMMIRELSLAVHDTAVGSFPDELEEVLSLSELRDVADRCWDLYWRGRYTEAGALTALFLPSIAARRREQAAGTEGEAWALTADAFRISAYLANNYGQRDLAYAAIGHAHNAAVEAGDDLRKALVLSGRAWVYLRDARLVEAFSLAEKSAADIEPLFSKATRDELTAYGNHVTFAAVVASRRGDADRAADFLSQAHATGARMGFEHKANGALFGPVTATTQAVGINVSLGQTGKALALARSVHDVSVLTPAARNRYSLDLALAQADAKMWDASLDTLEETLRRSPEWARHQELARVIFDKVGAASTARLRRVSGLLAGPTAKGPAIGPTRKTS